MKKLALLALLSVLFFAYGAWKLWQYPFAFYQKTLNERIDYPLLSLDAKPSLLSPAMIDEREYTEHTAEQALWRKFHLADVLLPLPYGNPLYQIVPEVIHHKDTLKPDIGVSYYDNSDELLLSLHFARPQMFSRVLDHQLFQVPVIQDYLNRISLSRLWQDMWEKDLKSRPTTWGQVIYNLYLYALRQHYLPKETLLLGASEQDKSFYVLEKQAQEPAFVLQDAYFYYQGMIYRYHLKISKKAEDAWFLRNKVLKGIQFQASSPSEIDIILEEFKALSYTEKIDQLGMMFLYSAWSHDTRRKDLFEKMIWHLERGKGNDLQLAKLFHYGLRRYGKTFSTRQNEIKHEGTLMKLKRNIELEQQRHDEALMLQKKPVVTPGSEKRDLSNGSRPKLDEKKKNKGQFRID